MSWYMQSFGTSSWYVPQIIKHRTGLSICSRSWLIANDHKSKKEKVSNAFISIWNMKGHEIYIVTDANQKNLSEPDFQKKRYPMLLAKLMTRKRQNLFKIHVLHSQSSHKQYLLFLGRKGILRASLKYEFHFSLS